MRVELLVVPGCPNEAPAREVLDRAAQLVGGLEVELAVIVIDSEEEAQRRGFVGSPTFLIEGVDAFPVPGASSAVACRVYQTRAGLSGVPDVEALREALVRACAGPATAAGDR